MNVITPKTAKLFRKNQEFADIYEVWIVDKSQNSKIYQLGEGKNLGQFQRILKMWCSHKPKANEMGNYQIREDGQILSISLIRVNSLEIETQNGKKTIFEVYFT